MALDTHCHLTLRFETQEIPDVLSRAHEAGVEGVLLVGYDPEHYRSVLDILERFGTSGGSVPALAGTVGIHPHEAEKHQGAVVDTFRDELERREIVAIGETGLDFFRDYAPRDSQEELFRAQARLAAETGFPLIIHSRSAFERTMEILGEVELPDPPGVFHCYGYGAEVLERVLDMGFFVSFAGNLTYPKAEELREACRAVPAERVLVETDSPFLVPQKAKNRKVRRNEPALVMETARKLAEVRDWEIGKAGVQLVRNTLACFPRLRNIESWADLAPPDSGEVAG